MTVFLTTHYMEEADRVAQRIAIIDHGRIVAQGTPAELKTADQQRDSGAGVSGPDRYHYSRGIRRRSRSDAADGADVERTTPMNAIYVLWLRQLKRYVRSRARMVGSLGQPLLFLVALGFGFGPIFQKAGQGNYIQFLAPGVIGMTILFSAVFSGIELIWDRQFGFLKETMVAPVPRIMIMIGRTLGGATVALVQGVIVVAICLVAGFRTHNLASLPLAFVFMALIALMFTAFGTAIASVLSDFQAFQLVMNFLIMPMFFLSGALFPLFGVPRALQIVAAVNPFAYGVDGMRFAFVGGVAHFGAAADLAVLSVITALLLGLGSYLFSKIQL